MNYAAKMRVSLPPDLQSPAWIGPLYTITNASVAPVPLSNSHALSNSANHSSILNLFRTPFSLTIYGTPPVTPLRTLPPPFGQCVDLSCKPRAFIPVS